MSDYDLSEAVFYHEGEFPPTDLDYQKLMGAVVGASTALARFDQMLTTLHNREVFLAPLRDQEAVLSSRMEGTISTLDEILQYEAEADDNEEAEIERAKSVRSDIVETVLYRRALIFAQKELHDGRPLRPSLLKGMHQLLLSFGRGAEKSPGNFKTEQNFIGASRLRKISYVPIAPEKLDEGMDRLFDYIGETDHPDLVQAAFAHLEFEALHPFQDGNGRIGRMLITLMLWKSGSISSPHFYISRYLEEYKDDYVDLMREVSEVGAWTDWCLFFLKAVEEQAYHNLKVAQQIRDLYEEMKAVFSDALSSKHALHVLDAVFTRPVFKNSHLVTQSGITAATASRFTATLLERGLLRQTQSASGRRAAVFSFEPMLELVRV